MPDSLLLVPHQEPSDTGKDIAVCDDSRLRPRLHFPQLTTVLQRDIEGKSRSFLRCITVLIPILCSEINSLLLNIAEKQFGEGLGGGLLQSSTFWKSTNQNHQNRRFRVTKRDNTFYVSTGLLSSFPDVNIL